MDLCIALRGGDVGNCVRGVRVPDLAQGPGSERLKLIRRCAHVDHAQQAACYRWLGLALNVVTNGRFATRAVRRSASRQHARPARPGLRPTKGRSRRSVSWTRRQRRAGSRRAGPAARAASGRRRTRPRSTRSRSARASSSCARARSASIAFTSTASSTSAIARSCSTLKKPGPVANSWTLVGRLPHVDARRAGLQRRDERSVAREHADLAVGARDDDHHRLALERRPVGCDERDGEALLEPHAATGSGSGSVCASAAASAFDSVSSPPSRRPLSTAFSIVPTM